MYIVHMRMSLYTNTYRCIYTYLYIYMQLYCLGLIQDCMRCLAIGGAPVLVFSESRLLLLGPAAQGLLDISAGLLVPLWHNVLQTSAEVLQARQCSQRACLRDEKITKPARAGFLGP